MTAYLDASVVVSLLVADSHTPTVSEWLRRSPRVLVSPWTITEFSSALSHGVRIQRIDLAERQIAESKMDIWLRGLPSPIVVEAEDFRVSRRLLRTHVSLRAPDALHLAIALRSGLPLATLDKTLAAAGAQQGVQIVDFVSWGSS